MEHDSDHAISCRARPAVESLDTGSYNRLFSSSSSSAQSTAWTATKASTSASLGNLLNDIPEKTFMATAQATTTEHAYDRPLSVLDSTDFEERNTSSELQQPSMKSPRYTLSCRQQPVHARMCGSGEKDRRPLDPPPILQCCVLDGSGQLTSEIPHDAFLTVHASLWNEAGTIERGLIATTPVRRSKQSLAKRRSSSPKISRVLMGSLVANPTILFDDLGSEGAFFVFPDLSVRTEGRYRLQFTLFAMNFASPWMVHPEITEITHCFSDAFIVYPAKKFPGMLKSTNV